MLGLIFGLLVMLGFGLCGLCGVLMAVTRPEYAGKAVHWIHQAERWNLLLESPWLFFQGQSIVGGLLGGLFGVDEETSRGEHATKRVTSSRSSW